MSVYDSRAQPGCLSYLTAEVKRCRRFINLTFIAYLLALAQLLLMVRWFLVGRRGRLLASWTWLSEWLWLEVHFEVDIVVAARTGDGIAAAEPVAEEVI